MSEGWHLLVLVLTLGAIAGIGGMTFIEMYLDRRGRRREFEDVERRQRAMMTLAEMDADDR